MKTDPRITEALVVELERKMAAGDGMDVTFSPVTAFQLTGIVQLALRHPKLSGANRTTAEKFVRAACEYFADCPAVLDVIRRGNDPQEDR